MTDRNIGTPPSHRQHGDSSVVEATTGRGGSVPTEPSPQPSAQRRETLLVIAPGVLLAILLTAWNYSAQPMWRDEWYTYSAAERTLPELVGLVSNVDGGLSVFYLVMHAWMLFGDSVAWMRVPAGLCTITITIVMALIGRRLGGTTVGVLSGVLITLLPAVTEHAQEARAYPLALAAVAGTGLMMLRYLEQPARRRAASLTALALLASTLHPIVGAPAVAGIFLGSWVAPGHARRRDLVKIGMPAGLAAGMLLAVGFMQVGTPGTSSWSHHTFLNFSKVVSPSLKEISLMALLAAAAVGILVRQNLSAATVLMGWIIVPIVTITTSTLAGSFFLSRYLSATALGVGVLVSYGVVTIISAAGDALPARHRRYANPLLSAAMLGILAVPLAPSIITLHTQPFRTDDPQSGAQALSRQWQEGDAAVFVGPVFRGLTNFYAPQGFDPADPLLKSPPIVDNSFRGRESRTSAVSDEVKSYSRIWLVGLLRQDKVYEFEKKEAATSGRILIKREDFGEFSLELWQ